MLGQNVRNLIAPSTVKTLVSQRLKCLGKVVQLEHRLGVVVQALRYCCQHIFDFLRYGFAKELLHLFPVIDGELINHEERLALWVELVVERLGASQDTSSIC